MAGKATTTIPSAVRTALDRLQRDGGRLVGQVERDIAQFTRRTRAQLAKETTGLRREFAQLAKEASRKLEGRPHEMLVAAEKRLAALEVEMRRRLDVGRAGDIASVANRISTLEQRVGELDRRLRDLADQLHDRIGTGAD